MFLILGQDEEPEAHLISFVTAQFGINVAYP